MPFSEILGHKRQLEVIRRSAASGKLPPAYLFHGDEGIGKRLAAMELARALNCERSEGGEPCGACRPCGWVGSGCHPNVRVVALEVNEKTDKLRQEIVIEQVRQAQEFLSLRPSGYGRKALVVDDAHLMNEESQNAFLKTLEEPPGESCVVLVTSRPDALLPTIRSRCRAVGFAPLSKEDVASALTARKGMSEGEARLVARLTGGRLGEALTAEPGELLRARAEMLDALAVLGRGRDVELMGLAESLARDEEGFAGLVRSGTLWFRDLLVLICGCGMELACNADAADELSAWAERVDAYGCERALGLLSEAARGLERTYNKRLLAEELLLGLREEALGIPAL